MFRRIGIALLVIAAGGFGGANSGGDHGGKAVGASGGRGISGAMSDALDAIQGGMRHALGIGPGPQPTSTKIGAVRDDATYEGVGAIGGDGGLGGDPNGGIGQGVGSTGDPSGSDLGY
jgi:hypothetical protein